MQNRLCWISISSLLTLGPKVSPGPHWEPAGIQQHSLVQLQSVGFKSCTPKIVLLVFNQGRKKFYNCAMLRHAHSNPELTWIHLVLNWPLISLQRKNCFLIEYFLSFWVFRNQFKYKWNFIHIFCLFLKFWSNLMFHPFIWP